MKRERKRHRRRQRSHRARLQQLVDTVASALYAGALRLLPAWLRRRDGREMRAVFGRRWRDARAADTGGLAGALARELGSVVWVALQARLLDVRERLSEPLGAPMHLVAVEGARSSDGPSGFGALGPTLTSAPDARGLKVAWVCALLAHMALFAVVLPEGGRSIDIPKPDVFRLQPPPPPLPERTVDTNVVKDTAPPVPIPDPTPDEPEPIVDERIVYESVLARPETDFAIGPPPAPPQQDPEGPVRAGMLVEAPRILHRVEPEYPELARRARLECAVILEAIIGTDGGVSDVGVLRGCGLGLDEAALQAVSQWQYTPTYLHGRPVEVLLTVTVVFRLLQ